MPPSTPPPSTPPPSAPPAPAAPSPSVAPAPPPPLSQPIAPIAEPTPPAGSPPAAEDTGSRAEKRAKKTPRKGLIPIVLLSVALLASLAVLGYGYFQLTDANTRIEQQDRELQEQKDLIDQKETFGAAMQSLLEKTAEFDGVRVTAVVPVDRYRILASRAWAHRWSPGELNGDILDVQAAEKDLTDILAAAATQATTNVTGTTNETVIDQLGGGFVASVIDDADTLCEADVLACVVSDDPYTVHFDAADTTLPYMNDWIRTGLAYHEFAHSLQMTNPGPTEVALAAFGGDSETMADCFALTYLDGWTLDHKIYVSSFEYWQVSIGYGYTCNEDQKQVIRTWYEQLGFHPAPISQ
ncbi:MAG: hypothetical protein ABIQ01_04090 [Pseudolysinimonas sp.]